MELLSIGKTELYKLFKERRLLSVKQGNSRRIPAVALTNYVQLLISEEEATHGQAA